MENNYLQFLHDDEGETPVELIGGIGFFSYTLSNGEMYVGKVFISKQYRSIKNALLAKNMVEKEAKKIGATRITGTVFLNSNNRHRFVKKLSFYEYLGFKPSYIQNNAVILVKELL